MNDSQEFEIDRPALVRYWQWQAFLSCLGASVGLLVPMTVSMGMAIIDPAKTMPIVDWFGWVVLFFLGGASAGAFVGTVLYLMLFRSFARRAAQNLRLIVEDAYVRTISGVLFVRDHRFHFKYLDDYALSDGPLLRWMKHKQLSFAVQSPTRHRVCIPCLVAPEKVRNLLCELDQRRENEC